MDINREYARWREHADATLQAELFEMDERKLADAFACDLTFGTGGLRGLLGAGTNRMNVHTVAKASQGLANYLTGIFPRERRSVAIAYDSRIFSNEFARIAAGVFAANGIGVWLYRALMPTPCLSFAVRELGCMAGVMITASHNPALYNGYKVYGSDGCQITTDAAARILSEIRKLDIFDDVYGMPFEVAERTGLIRYIPDSVTDDFISAVRGQSLLGEWAALKDISIIYTPLNGAGRVPVLLALRESGFTNVTVVKEQEMPDGQFPTCPYPNPESPDALTIAIEYAKRYDAALVLATDPDCDRVGVVARAKNGAYLRLSGNEVGLLLLDYICSRRAALGVMPPDPVFIKTIVTTSLAERVADQYGLRTVNVLTGFKFIGEQIGLLEKQGKTDSFVFAFEESCGYLSGLYVRDKDGVGATLLICEMASYYAARGINLPERLDTLYGEYGYCLDTMHSWEFDGVDGSARMRDIMTRFRAGGCELGGKRVTRCTDYAQGVGDLPRADVVRYILEDGCSVVLRPSGTEPKLKAYLSVTAASREEARAVERALMEDIDSLLGEHAGRSE